MRIQQSSMLTHLNGLDHRVVAKDQADIVIDAGCPFVFRGIHALPRQALGQNRRMGANAHQQNVLARGFHAIC
jgi:hypothetical protein